MASSSASTSPTLFSMARSKLHLSVGSKDNCSLHRWVLLKNSIVRSLPLTSSAAAVDPSDADPNLAFLPDDGDDYADDEVGMEEDSFMFPDAGKFVDSHTSDTSASESEWLNSLLETLGDDDDDEFGVDSDSHVSVPVDDDDDQLSPMASPMSSSDDLPNQSSYFSLPLHVYPVPYPPFHPPLIHSYDLDSSYLSPLSSLPPPSTDPLPYFGEEEPSMPDVIDDISDDESDTPPTLSLGGSSPSLSSVTTSLNSPTELSSLRHPSPRVYLDTDDSFFRPFELDPLPFPVNHQHHSYNPYQEC
ncbi:hypothetical protein BD779DRAFT_1509678 [Infundibulicybe gibba]|nr:hypothetical protein BD779DRAFT_1509678 [Infundibulicybe gibba]